MKNRRGGWLRAAFVAAMLGAALGATITPTIAQGPKREHSNTKPSSHEAEQVSGRAAKKAHVLVLGVFHMNNPGQDIFNLQVDDVLVPKRQKEIAETVAILKRFRPTKIALEADFGDDKMTKNYAAYLEGKYELTRNERDQLGLRLAKELGHKQIYSIDADGDFPFDKVQEFAKKSGKQRELDDWMKEIPKLLEKESTILRDGTITDLLQFVNRPEQARQDQEEYLDFAQFADGKQYPGPDLLAEWYRRNIRIYANLRNIITSPEDRVLVIFGAGHLYWLQRDVIDSRDLELLRFADYLPNRAR